MVSRDEPHGHTFLQIGQAKIHDNDTQAYSWATAHVIGRLSEAQRSDSEIRIVSVPVVVRSWKVGTSTHTYQ